MNAHSEYLGTVTIVRFDDQSHKPKSFYGCNLFCSGLISILLITKLYSLDKTSQRVQGGIMWEFLLNLLHDKIFKKWDIVFWKTALESTGASMIHSLLSSLLMLAGLFNRMGQAGSLRVAKAQAHLSSKGHQLWFPLGHYLWYWTEALSWDPGVFCRHTLVNVQFICYLCCADEELEVCKG